MTTTPPPAARFGRPAAPRNTSWPRINSRMIHIISELDALAVDLANAGFQAKAAILFRLLCKVRLLREDIEVDQHRRPIPARHDTRQPSPLHRIPRA